jgi:hypothetical protein
MAKEPISAKQMVAFKIGARARKFASEGCPIEGYELLYGAIAEAKDSDSEMHGFLQTELERYQKRIDDLDDF